ncbi:MAG: tetraacyldisaccharide 4'-kinase, partial [Burkholderiales bacterium]|nr:tetraacyldisaccharide 4'-kinase [Burkholderiales bacterium]
NRAPGSRGSGTTPGRVYKGARGAGHMGVDRVTAQNIKVVMIDRAGLPPSAQALQALAAEPDLLAAAGLAEPERFFTMLRAQGLNCRGLPLPDHARLDTLPWPTTERTVLLTEKDAVKLAPVRVPAGQTVWVVALDFQLPRALVDEIDQALHACLPYKPAR